MARGRPVRRILTCLALVAIAGAAWFLAISSFTGAVAHLTTGELPDATLRLAAGEQKVFLEGDLFNGVKTCRCPRARSAFVLVDGPTGPVPVTHVNGSYFQLNELDGVQIGRIDVPADGSYRVHTNTAVGDAVAIGRYSPSVLLFFVAFALSAFALLYLIFADPFSRVAPAARGPE